MGVVISYHIDTSEAKLGLARARELRNFKEGMIAAGGYLVGQEANYPPESHRKLPFGFVSEKQRRAFFAMLRNGIIQVPYFRTGGLQRSMRLSVENGGMIVRTGTSLSRAEWTHGQKQALYHRITGWRQMATIAQSNGGDAYMIVYRAAQRDFE